MQNYTKIQKILSSFLIFSILFSFTIQTPVFQLVGTIFAADTTNYNVVSLFVQEELYPSIKSGVDTYARNIQKTLENTKTMIIPIPSDTHPYNIASLNEKLYFEGYNWLDGLSGKSHLIGTVFIWDIALPVVENKWNYEKTVLPYVDFDEKAYIYDTQTHTFSYNSDTTTTPKAEIWHGFISPNTWNAKEDIQEINDYFEKNNDFYEGEGLFENQKGVMNGNQDEKLIDEYEPYVFYYDQLRESKALKYTEYLWYKAYLDNIEDLAYKRYTQDLAERLKNIALSGNKNYMQELQSLLWNSIDLSGANTGPTTFNIPDIQLQHVIKESTKNFLEIFNDATLWDMRKDVHNAGRYNSWSNIVNVDLIPTFVNTLDVYAENILKNVNNDLEARVDDLVKKGLSRNIAIPATLSTPDDTFTNYLYGKKALEMTNAAECSFYRGSTFGSGQLIVSSRAYNFNLAEWDANLCKNWDTLWYWGWYSPLNLSSLSSTSGDMWALGPVNAANAIVPAYDIIGGKKILDATKNPDPRLCFENNLLLPVNKCDGINKKLYYPYNFENAYKNLWTPGSNLCGENKIYLDGEKIKTYTNATCGSVDWDSYTIAFHKISSYITHKSPTHDEIVAQNKYMVAPNLAVDKDRYIDFIAANDSYAKINYPYLFRLNVLENGSFDFEKAKLSLKNYLDQYSTALNQLIGSKSPAAFSGSDLEIYEILKTGNYPQANLDLYKEMSEKPAQKINILWDEKELTYIDTLAFALVWNNLETIGAKYKFIFQYYLWDQFQRDDFHFFLPKNKKNYEITYLGAPWDAQNMYIKMDPEDKSENPYADIIKANESLKSYLISVKDNQRGSGGWSSSSTSEDGSSTSWEENSDETSIAWSGGDKCAPPEGVPIWEWLPAVMCWLKDMLPPKISFNEGSCWLPYMNLTWDEPMICTACQQGGTFPKQDVIQDTNRNGVEDSVENGTKNSYLEFTTSDPVQYYHKTSQLQVSQKDRTTHQVITYNNTSEVNIQLVKLTIPLREDNELTAQNSNTIFDLNNPELHSSTARDEAKKYLIFSDIQARLSRGVFLYNYSTTSTDIDAVLRATTTLKDTFWNVINTQTQDLTIQVRGDLLFANTSKLSKVGGNLELNPIGQGVEVSDMGNIFLWWDDLISKPLTSLDNLSTASEKLFVSVAKKDKSGKNLPISFPLKVNIYDERGREVISQKMIQSLSNPITIASIKTSWVYLITIEDGKGFVVKKQVTLTPAKASTIDAKLSTDVMEKWWVITSNVFSLYDRFGNPAAWDIYSVEANISWNSVVFEDGSKSQIYTLYDAYRVFRLKSTPVVWESSITFTLKYGSETITTQKLSVLVLDAIHFDITWDFSNVKVGGDKYNYILKATNIPQGRNFQARSYLIPNATYIRSGEDYVDSKNGEIQGTFYTKTRAWENISLGFSVEWVKDMIYKEIDIFPEVGLKLDFSLSQTKIEATPEASSVVYVEIKDRYNNIVWNDNSTQISLMVHPKYANIITVPTPKKQVSKGKAVFTLSGTEIPGSAYFKLSSTPSLSNNTMKIAGQSPFAKEKLDSIPGMRSGWVLTDTGKEFFWEFDEETYRFLYYSLDVLQASTAYKKLSFTVQNQLVQLFKTTDTLVVKWVGENAGKIETFYFWNKKDITDHAYNGLYTTLLGSNYGDITTPNNLANSLIFDKKNRALWVTSLLSNTKNSDTTFSIKPDGNLKIPTSSNLSQDIVTSILPQSQWGLLVTFDNATFDQWVGSIHYVLKNPKLIENCTQNDPSKCFDAKNTSVVLQSTDSNYTPSNIGTSWLKLVWLQWDLINISPNGVITLAPWVSLELRKNLTKGLVLSVKFWGKVIGYLSVWFVWEALKFTRENTAIDIWKQSLKNSWIIVYVESRDYFVEEQYLDASTKGQKWLIVQYNDPFASTQSWKSQFDTYFEGWYEKFTTTPWVGWKEENKILLSFAAGKTIWESTKDFESFGLINIWDPVASLKPVVKNIPWTPKTKNFDSTIGELISKDENSKDYNIFDYNNDTNTDVVILKNDGYIDLLQWTGNFWDFLPATELLYVPDISQKSPLFAWDFSWDGYGDIAVISNKRELILFVNTKKDFERISTNISPKIALNQVAVADMNKDGKTDFVVLDELGELAIYYGTSTPGTFTKKVVETWLWVKIDGSKRTDGGALYFNGLYQLPQNTTQDYVLDSENLLKQFKENGYSLQNPWDDELGVNENMVDKMIFTQLNYTPFSKRWVISSRNDEQNLLENIEIPEILWGSDDAKNALWDLLSLSWVIISGNQDANHITTFLKSEYATTQWVVVEKSYSDINGAPLVGWDSIEYTLTLKNTSGKILTDLAYVEKIPDMFQINTKKPITLKIAGKEIFPQDGLIEKSPSGLYTFLLDNYKENEVKKPLQLLPNETLELQIFFTSYSFLFGSISLWDFDSKTSDQDIMFREQVGSTTGPGTLYYSDVWWNYTKKAFAPSCNTWNAVSDADGNGVPDYIDNLIEAWQSWDVDAMQDYAKDALDDWFGDSDWNEPNFMNSLDQLDEKIDSIMMDIDTILAWLSCGFGWGGCVSTPLNWAPLAPGSDPTLFWYPIGDGLKVGEWLPIFAAPTKWYPPIWPPSPTGAWGWLDKVPTGLGISQFRIFVTPTLTWWVWVAICFGSNNALWWSPFPGISPLVPGWNCIVAAKPLIWCKNDGSDGEVYNYGDPGSDIINGWGIVNGGTSMGGGGQDPYLWDIAWEYINYKSSGYASSGLKQSLKDVFSQVATPSGNYYFDFRPLLNIWDSNQRDFSIDIDFAALRDGNFSDVIDVQMNRISPFPDFIMEWVTRQIEEIANKLTDFPTLYIILPDFKGVFDAGWKDFFSDLDTAYQEWEEQMKEEKEQIAEKIGTIQAKIASLNCNTRDVSKKDPQCLALEGQLSQLQGQYYIGKNQAVWWVKWVYQFLSNMPIVRFEPQKVEINLPWADKATIDKAIQDFEAAKYQWTQELQRAQSEWSAKNYNCVGDTSLPGCKWIVDLQNLISSVDRNIQILKHYQELPNEVYKMLRIKDIWLEQLLCNVEIISKITWGWIWENGKRFKAWVELYVLIKAILKSWQLLVDVFIDYEAECHQCKNERYDLQYFIWKLISSIMPKIPVIRFPKWPDIYLDLHDIRVAIDILLPEFEFHLRPIVLPSLPDLYLPDSPNINIHIPTLPILPDFYLPELPELPSLPTVELPNLPPPPKLPKLLSAIEAFLKILKLITKAMCILRSSPFVPEWRAWDQIAFITERQWYMPFDFLDFSLPEFSFPFVDAIKVSTYVNLELNIDFLTEMARQATLPLNVFGNDIATMFFQTVGDLDFRGWVPQSIDVEVWKDGGVDMSYQNTQTKKVSLYQFALLAASTIYNLSKNIEKLSAQDLSNDEFKEEIAKQLPNISNEKIVGTWNQALNYSFTKENALIEELQKNNSQKYEEVQSILQEEKQKNIDVMTKLEQNNFAPTDENIQLVSSSATSPNIQEYNSRLEVYKQKAGQALQNMLTPDSEVQEIKTTTKQVVAQVQWGIQNYANQIGLQTPLYALQDASVDSWISWGVTSGSPVNGGTVSAPSTSLPSSPQGQVNGTSVSSWTSSSTSSSSTSCDTDTSIYKGIYVIENFLGKKLSYYLFDYIDELTGKEVAREADFDNDGDQDIIYMVGDEIYIKQNYNTSKQKRNLYTGSPIVLPASRNVFLAGNFLPAINGWRESFSESNYLNLEFKAQSDIQHYRAEMYTVVDKFIDMQWGGDDGYIPQGVKKSTFEMMSEISSSTLISQNQKERFTLFKNPASISSLNDLGSFVLRTPQLIDLSEDLAQNISPTINAKTPLYAAWYDVRVRYYVDSKTAVTPQIQEVKIPHHSHIEFAQDIVVVGLIGKAYVANDTFITLKWNQIASYINKPLLPGSTIITQPLGVSRQNLTLTIAYFDGTQTLLNANMDAYYELYDLWNTAREYSLRTPKENDFYYGKIQAVSPKILWTQSVQKLFSPQIWSDNSAPQISWFSSLKIPVYSQKIFDISDKIYENSGNENIKNISIDLDVWKDSDWDGNPSNDQDISLTKSDPLFTIEKDGGKILLKVWPYTSLIEKKIKLFVEDQNHNIASKEINFQVYSPIPNIEEVDKNHIEWSLDESLDGIPVHFYRLRGNALNKVGMSSTDTFSGGLFDYSYATGAGQKWITVFGSGETLFTIDEKTGKIDISPAQKILKHLEIWVRTWEDAINTLWYPEVHISQNGASVYSEYFAFQNMWEVFAVSSFDEVWSGDVWMYYKHGDGTWYQYEKIPFGVPYNPWDIMIYATGDSKKTPLVILSKDGRITLASKLYFLEYTTYKDSIVLEIKKRGQNTPIGSVLIHPEENYILK